MDIIGSCIVLLVGLITSTAGNYPLNPRAESGYRSITVRWDDITNFNSSGTAKQLEYQIEAKMVDSNKTDYLLSTDLVIFNKEPTITVQNLRVNTYVTFRIGLKSDLDKNPMDLSPKITYGTKSIEDLGAVEVPGKVRNIAVKDYAKEAGTHEITWDRPTNIASATGNDSSVSYRIRTCNYNPLKNLSSQCKIVGEVVGISSQDQQSSYQDDSNLHTHQFITIPQNRDMAIEITGISLNSTAGPIETKTMRLNASSVPAAPTGVRIATNTSIWSSEISIAWDYNETWTGTYMVTYLVEYKEQGGQAMTKEIKKNKEITIDGLKSSTVYEIRVGVSESPNGASPYSSKFTVKTSNVTKPTIAPPTTPSVSSTLLSSALFIAFAMLFVVAQN